MCQKIKYIEMGNSFMKVPSDLWETDISDSQQSF